MVSDTSDTGLDRAIGEVYRGPLDGFVQRRDALAKELRAAGRRADATAVRRLRKPNRTAWALDVAVLDDSTPFDRVAEAVAGVVAAQSGPGGDLRGAVERMRGAARELARAAARASADAGHPVDQAVLSPAVMSVIGNAAALEELRAGRLAAIPTAGGLGFVTADAVSPVGTRVSPSEGVEPASQDTEVAEAAAAAADALRQAEAAAATARERAEAAKQAVRDTETAVEDAEERRRRADQQVEAARRELTHVRQEAKTARAELRQAERKAARARKAFERHDGSRET